MEQLDSTVFYNNYKVFGYLDSDFVTFFSEDIGLNSITLVNINLDDDHFDCCDPETVNHIRLMGWYNKYNAKHQKKIDKELRPIAWHPRRVRDWLRQKIKRKKLAASFYRLNLTIKIDYCESG